jgi:propionyl-CoA synthetase
LIAESCVVGIPDSLKGHLPFAFITLSTPSHPTSPVPRAALVADLQARVREQIGAVAALGGVVQGQGMIPKTRSGKTLRRVLRELVENAVEGKFDRQVSVPATVEDAAVVEVAREKIKLYFESGGGKERHRSKL